MVSKSIFSSLGKNEVFIHMPISISINSQSVFLSFQLIRRIVGPNKDDSDQRS